MSARRLYRRVTRDIRIITSMGNEASGSFSFFFILFFSSSRGSVLAPFLLAFSRRKLFFSLVRVYFSFLREVGALDFVFDFVNRE